ncbi:hypothetical protein NHP21005_02370 [Helicobacter sp. NHP21005]|uniref:hypothetical protein n=1 Tax=Helicobacter felistomachi TaxID=3040201 RepID=UPI0025730FBF|nr:hypothetical protein [Helicobacter sp. NHP21005]BEG56549.1 hypothetical protein NHP21005_02370 [Helicobacter sp. NHP21005]
MKTIHLFADAHPQSGLGHLRRMQKLKALLEPMAQVRLFAPHPLADIPIEWLKSKISGAHLTIIDSYLAQPTDYAQIQTPLIIFEDLFAKERLVPTAKSNACCPIYIVNPAHHAHTAYPKELQTHPHYFLGSGYHPIDPVFCAHKPLQPTPQKILLCLGGSDLVLTPLKRALELLKPTTLQIHTIAPKPLLPHLSTAPNFSFEPLVSPIELAKRLKQADLALFSGGQMVYEAILSQTPLVSLPIASNQLPQVQALATEGALLCASLDNLLNALQSLLDLKDRERMQAAQRGLKLGGKLLPALQKILAHA